MPLLEGDLKSWYARTARPLPWRKAKPDPYEVWISEVMSQQSTMASVQPYFARWMAKFPTVDDLARAHEEEVLAAWAGLGYYSRARNVHRAARELRARLEEKRGWPRTMADWMELPGVGPYSAAAVASICFSDRVLPLDGNVVRVLARLTATENPLNDRADLKRVEARLRELAAGLRPGGHALIGQALMELGSLVCRPGALAACEGCPLRSACAAYAQGRVAQIPRPKQRPEPKLVRGLALVYRDPKGACLLRRIPEGKRLAGQWELPLWELPEGSEGERIFREVQRDYGRDPAPVRHLITRYIYSIQKVEAGRWPERTPPEGHRFWVPGTPPPGTITTLTRKILLI